MIRRMTGPSRRSLLVGGVTMAGLAGGSYAAVRAGVRLDTPPPKPPIPTRITIPDEALLISAWQKVDSVRATSAALQSGQVGPELAARVTASHTAQSKVIRGLLTNGGVPTKVIDLRAPSPPAAGKATKADLIEVEQGLVTWPKTADLLAAQPATVQLLLAVKAYAMQVVAALGGGEPQLPTKAAQANARLLGLTYPLVYGLQVATAQSSGEQRQNIRALWGETKTWTTLLLGATPPPGPTPSPAYALPFEVTTAQDANKLVKTMLSNALRDVWTAIPAKPTGADLEAVTAYAALVARTAALWGVPSTPFPGLQLA